MNYAKAVIAALVAGLTAIGTGLTDGGLSPQEWVAAAIAFLVALSAVWSTPPGPGQKTPKAVAHGD